MHTTSYRLAVCSFQNKYQSFIVQETLPSLLSTGWFHERIRAWFT